MDENNTRNNIDSIDRVVFIIRYIFFGFLLWSYWSTVFTISRKSTTGLVIAAIALLLLLIFKESINPIKTNKREFGKYTDVIGILVSIIFVFTCLVPLFGLGFYK